MNELNIDVSSVKTMGAFRVAIQNAVSEYISAEMYGIHGVKNNIATATSGQTTTEKINVAVDLTKEFGEKTTKHWGIFNILNQDGEYTTHTTPQTQIIVWWDNESEFSYSINHNALGTIVSATSNPPQELQYIAEDSVDFDNDTNILTFTIINEPRVWNGTNGTTTSGTFHIDYHVW